MNPADWTSLTDQRAVAAELFGEQGEQLLTEWLDSQTALIDNLDYARQFSDNIDLPGAQPMDYAHRFVKTTAGNLLGGIRFYRRNLSRPFVEIVAHTFDDLDALRDCVRAEWSMFTPRDLRLRARPHSVTSLHARLDVSVFAARYSALIPPDGRVTLQPFDDPADAVALVEKRFADMQRNEPDLFTNVTPADPDELRAWHADDRLRAIVASEQVVGLLAILSGAVDWITGDEVYEEVVDTHFGGHGYAAAAQSAWAHTVATDCDTLLVGTIDHLNVASRRSAQRAGRPRILDDVFISLAN